MNYIGAYITYYLIIFDYIRYNIKIKILVFTITDRRIQ